MKITKLGCWLGTTLLYGYVFYEQSAGINFLIFNSILLISVFALQPELRQRRSTLAVAAGCLLTALNVAWHPTWTAIVMNLISLLGLSGLSLQPESSLVVAWINGVYSLVVSSWKKTFGWMIPAAGEETDAASVAPAAAGITVDKLISHSVPVLVVGAFFLLYTHASPAFSALFSGVSLDFISVWWVIFTLFGAYLLLAFFYPVAISFLVRFDLATPDQLTRQRRSDGLNFNPVGLRYEYRSAWLLFVMLNGLLLFFNAVDIFYLLTQQLPEGVTHSAFVHQGVNTLIASVVLAIAVVMYFFRGNLNFLRGNRRLKVATYGWIIQNAVLIVATASKNFSYISEYGLTHKRIGVYVYLLLTLIGLVMTYFKVRDVKSNWFLLRKNAWLFYAVLILFSTLDWSRIITHHNLSHLDDQEIDISYLIGLSDSNLDLLEKAYRTHQVSLRQAEQIQRQINYFVRRKKQEDWLSWNYAEHQVYQRLRRSERSPYFYDAQPQD